MQDSPAIALTGSGVLISAPFWVDVVNTISLVAGMISMVAGAAIGVITLYRMWKNRNKTDG